MSGSHRLLVFFNVVLHDISENTFIPNSVQKNLNDFAIYQNYVYNTQFYQFFSKFSFRYFKNLVLDILVYCYAHLRLMAC